MKSVKTISNIDNNYKTNPVPLQLEIHGKSYKGEAKPVSASCKDGVCYELDITLNEEHLGIISCTKNGWRMNEVEDQQLVNAIGDVIILWYE